MKGFVTGLGLLLVAFLCTGEALTQVIPEKTGGTNKTPAAKSSSDKAATPALPDAPVEMMIVPQREIYTIREGLQVQMVFRAIQPVNLCFQKDPLAQFDIGVYRSGKGPLRQAPLVVQDTSVLFDQTLKIVHLDPGRSIPYRLSLRRINFLGGERWTAGDYTVNATFHLCDQAAAARLQANPMVDATSVEGKDTEVRAVNQGHFMIMD